jgi:histidinol-phosphate aminotransferase
MSHPGVDGLLSPRPRFRDAYQTLGRYRDAGDQRAGIDLSDNTNLWGAPPAAARVIGDAMGAIARYPAAYATTLVAGLADYCGVGLDMVVTGCGSDDVLDAAMRAFADPGATLALPDPTFPMAATLAQMNGLTPVAVPLTRARHIDVDALVETDAPIIYVASPSNPLGVAAPASTLEDLVDRAPGFVIIDAAYAEFAGSYAATVCALARRSERVLIVRTMSKAWGLAGLRIGYACGAPRLIAEVEKSRGPYKVSILGERVATEALRLDGQWVAARVAEAVANRDRLAAALTVLGLPPLPSDANFLLVPVAHVPGGASAVTTALRALDVSVRSYPALRGIGDAVRITVAPWLVMARFLVALEAALAVWRASA